MQDTPRPDIALSVRTIVGWATGVAMLLLALGYARETFVAFSDELSYQYGAKLIRLDGERNLAAWYSSMLLAGIGALMLAISAVERLRATRTAAYWLVLGIIFFVLSLDELLALHEGLGFLHGTVPNIFGIFTFAWVLVAIPVVAALALAFIPFLRRLPRPTAIRLVVAGIVYVTGAIGFEMLGAFVGENYSTGTPYDIVAALEETLELSGLLLALRCVLLHLAERGPEAGIRFVSR